MTEPPPDPARLARLRARALEHVLARRLPRLARLLDMAPAKLERFLADRPSAPAPAAPSAGARRVREALRSLVAGLPPERREEGVAALSRTLREAYAERPGGAPAWVEALPGGGERG